WLVIGQTAVSSSLTSSTFSTPGFGNVSRPAYASLPACPRATNSLSTRPGYLSWPLPCPLPPPLPWSFPFPWPFPLPLPVLGVVGGVGGVGGVGCGVVGVVGAGGVPVDGAGGWATGVGGGAPLPPESPPFAFPLP